MGTTTDTERKRRTTRGRFTWRLNWRFARARKERYGLDVTGPAKEVADHKRLLRNARKVERHAV